MFTIAHSICSNTRHHLYDEHCTPKDARVIKTLLYAYFTGTPYCVRTASDVPEERDFRGLKIRTVRGTGLFFNRWVRRRVCRGRSNCLFNACALYKLCEFACARQCVSYVYIYILQHCVYDRGLERWRRANCTAERIGDTGERSYTLFRTPCMPARAITIRISCT